jgi:hypothetical protein
VRTRHEAASVLHCSIGHVLARVKCECRCLGPLAVVCASRVVVIPMAARNVVRHRQFCVSYFTLKREFQMSYDNLMG